MGEEEKKSPGLAGKVFRSLGEAAGKLLTTAAHTATTTGQRAALHLVSRVGDRPIPQRTPLELARSFAAWLQRRHKGQAECKASTVELSEDPSGRHQVVLQEPGMLGQTYFFHFLTRAQGTLEPGPIYLALSWPPQRCDLPKDLCLFLWNHGVQLGPSGAAADYISLWLADELGFRFDSLELAEAPRAKSPSPRFYVGREAEMARLVEWASEPDPSADAPYVVCLTGLGGSGKSYFLRHFQQHWSKRLLISMVDHQNCEGCEQSFEQGLLRLLQSLALGFQAEGCPTPAFDRLYVRRMRQPAETGWTQVVRKAVDFTAGRNPLMALASAGWQTVDRVAEEIQAESDALATNSWIRRLTSALVSDLQQWVRQQQKRYFLWRRPVLIFDTYELLSVIADTWLRVVLLSSPEFLELRPLVLVAGRHELLRINSRWSEFQGALQHLPLAPFGVEEVARFLELHRGDPKQATELLELTGGHPLFLSLVAASPSREMALRTLVERLLEEVEAPFRDLVLDMAVPPAFNLDLLTSLHPDLPEPRRAFERLLRLTFVEAEGGRWRYAENIRSILLGYLELESPQRLQQLRQSSSS